MSFLLNFPVIFKWILGEKELYVLRTKGISLPKINKGFLDDTTTMTNSFVYEKKAINIFQYLCLTSKYKEKKKDKTQNIASLHWLVPN